VGESAGRKQESGDLQRYTIHHLAGDFDAAAKSLPRVKDPSNTLLHLTLTLDQIKPAEALEVPDAEDYLDSNGMLPLAMSIAWQAVGDADQAAEYRGYAANIYSEGTPREQRAAAMLVSATPPTAAELDALELLPEEKRVLCVALGQKFPAERARCFSLAQKLNFMRSFPHHLLKQAMALP
jgi:hypothetical protein